MTLNWERKRFDDFILLFNNQSPFVSKDSSNNILTFKSSPDEVSRAIDLNFTMSINFSDKGDLSLCNREIKMTRGVNVFNKVKSFWQMSEILPVSISEYSWESCTVVFLDKSPVRFLIVVILQESLTCSSKGRKVGTTVSSKHSLLPEFIKTFNRGISSRFSLWNEYQMYAHEQMKTDKLGDTVGVASSTSSCHLIIHLRYSGNPQMLPCFDEMLTKGDGLFVGKLAGGNCMPCHIHSMKGIELGNPFWTSEMSGSHNVCLMEISNPLSLNIWIRLVIVVSFFLDSSCLPMSRENSGNSRDGRNFTNLSLCKLPVNNLSSNSREGRTACPMRLQFFSNTEDLFKHMLRSFSPDSFWSTTLVFETIKSMLFKSFEPFGEPSFTLLNQLEYFVKTVSFFVKLYCFATFFISLLIVHRLYLLPKVFGRSLGDVKIGLRCYDIFKVYDVMI